jgi:hypothetical protein
VVDEWFCRLPVGKRQSDSNALRRLAAEDRRPGLVVEDVEDLDRVEFPDRDRLTRAANEQRAGHEVLVRRVEVVVRRAETAAVEVVEKLDLRHAGRRARGIHVAAAGGHDEERDEREQGETPHHSESFLIHESTPLS